MDTLFSLLQEEVSHLRELLSNFTLEEKWLLSQRKESLASVLEERQHLQATLDSLQKRKKGFFDNDGLEISSLLEQIQSLTRKIAEKQSLCKNLKTMKQYELPKKEKDLKKRGLLLEDGSVE